MSGFTHIKNILKLIRMRIKDTQVDQLHISDSGVNDGYPYVDLESGERFHGFMADIRHANHYLALNRSTKKVLDKRAYWAAVDTARSYQNDLFDRERYYSINKGDTVLQVGAYHGHDTVRFSRAVGKSGRVIAVEASKSNKKILEQNVNANELENVEIINTALSDSSGTISFYESERPGEKDNTYEISNYDSFDYDDSELIKRSIKTKRTDEMLNELGVPEIDYTILTVNGAEADVLRGMGTFLNPSVAVVSVGSVIVDGQPLYKSIQEICESKDLPTVVEQEEIGEVVYAGPGVSK